MAAGNWIMYNAAKEDIGDGTIDLDNDTFTCTLHTSTYTPALTDTSVTNEVANGNGYTTGGVTLTCTWAADGGDVTSIVFDCTSPDPIRWTAFGGSIVARHAVINDTTAGVPLCYCLLDTAPADVTASDGGTFDITIAAGGIFDADGADS